MNESRSRYGGMLGRDSWFASEAMI